MPKQKTRSDKFPLTLHPTGQFCKKIGGKIYYFGTDKQIALKAYLAKASSLHSGKAEITMSPADNTLSLGQLCNLYLDHQHTRANAGEIGLVQISDQTSILKKFARFLGRNTPISQISTLDLQRYRALLIKGGKSTVTKQLDGLPLLYPSELRAHQTLSCCNIIT